MVKIFIKHSDNLQRYVNGNVDRLKLNTLQRKKRNTVASPLQGKIININIIFTQLSTTLKYINLQLRQKLK